VPRKKRTVKLKRIDYVPVQDMTDAEVVDYVATTKRRAVKAKDDGFKRCKDYRRMYMALDPSDDVINESSGKIDEDKRMYSRTYLPIGAALVDAAATQLYNFFFHNEDYFEIVPEEWVDTLRAFRITEHLKKRHREMKFRNKVYQLLQMIGVFDYAVSFTRWKLRGGYVQKRKNEVTRFEYGGMSFPYREVKIETEWMHNAVDRCDLEIISYFNCAHDPEAKDGFDDSRYFIDWRKEPVSELIGLAETKDQPWGKYKNLDKVIGAQGTQSDASGAEQHDPVTRESEHQEDLIKIDRLWTPDHVVEVADGFVISRTNIDGYPLQKWGCYNAASEFRSIGVLERIERNGLDINAIINQRRDAQNLMNNPFVIMDEDLVGLEDDSPEIYPGKVMTSSGGIPKEKIYVYQPGVDTSQSMTMELSLQLDVIKELVAIGSNQMANFTPGRTTAREVSAVAAGSMSRAALIASNLEDNCLLPIYNRMFLLEQLNLSQSEQFRYEGPNGAGFLIIRPEDYRWSSTPRFRAKGAQHLENKDVRIAQMSMLLKAATEIPGIADARAIFLDLAQMLSPKSYHKYVKDPRRKQYNIPPQVENQMLALGHQVPVSQENNHQEHLTVHSQILNGKDYQIWPENMKLNHKAHIQQHQQAMKMAQGMVRQPQGSQDQSDAMRGVRGAEVRR